MLETNISYSYIDANGVIKHTKEYPLGNRVVAEFENKPLFEKHIIFAS